MANEAREEVTVGAAYAHLAAGEIAENGAQTFFRHLDGALCLLREAGLEPEDARNCVRGGADVFVNPQGLGTPSWVMCWPCDARFWIRNADADELGRSAPIPLDGPLPTDFSLFMGPDGEAVVTATGPLAWGPVLRVLDQDGTTMPGNGVLLQPALPSTADDGERAFRIVER